MSIYKKSFVVADEHSAKHWASPQLDVFATPSMVAFMENTAYDYCEQKLDEGQTTVGAGLEVKHLAATKIGQEVEVVLTEVVEDGRLYHFTIEVYEGEKLIGTGKHSRAVIDLEKFLARLG